MSELYAWAEDLQAMYEDRGAVGARDRLTRYLLRLERVSAAARWESEGGRHDECAGEDLCDLCAALSALDKPIYWCEGCRDFVREAYNEIHHSTCTVARRANLRRRVPVLGGET